jgi:hypothetical protein
MDISKNVIPDLTSPIRSADECVTLEDALHILKVDLVIAQIGLSLRWVPIEFPNLREQRPKIIWSHGQRSPSRSISRRVMSTARVTHF